FLKIQQIPGRFRRIRCAVDGGMILKRRIEKRRYHEQSERPNHGGDEFDDQEMGPNHGSVFDALVDANDRVLADECEQAKTLFLPWEWLRTTGSGHLGC